MSEYLDKAVERDVYRILVAFGVLSVIIFVSAFMVGRCSVSRVEQPQGDQLREMARG